MTAADRPSVTDNARAEAERRWPHGEYRDPLMRGAMREKQRAFVAGAEWAAGRAETTTATTEDAARVINEVLGGDMDNHARIAAHRLADAGLLATARTATTEDAEEVLHGAGWFARADLDPRDLRGILRDLAEADLLRDGAR